MAALDLNRKDTQLVTAWCETAQPQAAEPFDDSMKPMPGVRRLLRADHDHRAPLASGQPGDLDDQLAV
jgi:hypothetical protein